MPYDTVIVTPTRRLSRYLRFQYAAEQLQKGNKAWETPPCLPWSAWCQQLHEQLLLITPEKYQLLNDNQQQWIWQDVINRSRYRQQLLQVNATARQAMRAYRLCQQWAIPIFPDDVFLSEDALAFKSWVNSYEQCKAEQHWLDSATLPDTLRENIEQLRLPTRIVFQGFDRFTTQQQALIDALQRAGTDIEQRPMRTRNDDVAVYTAGDKQAEIWAAACWAREKLQANPQATIGIVTPRLQHNRGTIINVFTSVFSPNSLLEAVPRNSQVWSVALGKPLSEYPMIATALELLALGRRTVATQNLGKLLHSRFIKGCDEELPQRAQFDSALRQAGIEQLSLKSLYRFAEFRCDDMNRCGQFIQLVKDFEISFLSHARTQTWRQWAILFSEWLGLFGWPADRAINSAEHQTLLAWQDCLHDLGRLDPGGQRVGYAEAYAQLRRIVQENRFQPETPETPIQVTGLEGSAGMQFDYLWILDMQDDYWPEQSVPNAFVPRTLQQAYGVPSATAESRLAHAQRLTEGLIASAEKVVLSYARQEGDRECRPTPLIHDYLANAYAIDQGGVTPPAATIQQSGRRETFTDVVAPPIPAGKVARGGSALFRDQSQCPFRAFARHRLHATSLPLTDIGLSAAERGNLTHQALQYLWQRLGNQARLLYLSENESRKLVESVVSEAIKLHATQQPDIFTERFSLLEQQRLEQLLHRWLMVERQRSPFAVIATEEWQTVHFQDLECHLRVDRVDELADGSCVIIDYKTGQVRKSDWDSDHPADPQLPLYAVTSQKEVAAIAFASLKPGDLKYQGEAEADGILPGIKQDKQHGWQERLGSWRVVLQRLAQEFRDGKATVEPLVIACRYCDLQSLCRLYERIETLDAEMLQEDASD